MKIEYIKDPAQKNIKIAVIAAEKDACVSSLIEELERTYQSTLNGYSEGGVQPLYQKDIISVWSEGQRVRCRTHEGDFDLHARLYEMEERLDQRFFVRISKCEIVNVRKILRLDVSLSGTVGVTLEGGIKTYTSRRYMKKLKDAFGV